MVVLVQQLRGSVVELIYADHMVIPRVTFCRKDHDNCIFTVRVVKVLSAVVAVMFLGHL